MKTNHTQSDKYKINFVTPENDGVMAKVSDALHVILRHVVCVCGGGGSYV